MKKLIIFVFAILVSLPIVNAQKINNKKGNFFVENKIEPIIGFNAAFNGVGVSTEGYVGLVVDKHFMFTVGGLFVANYAEPTTLVSSEMKSTKETPDYITGIRGAYVKSFLNISSLVNPSSRIIIGPAIAVGSFSMEYVSKDTNTKPDQDVKLKVMPSVEIGYQVYWARVVGVIKYIGYEDVHGEKSGNFFGGVSLTIPFSFEMHKKHFNDY